MWTDFNCAAVGLMDTGWGTAALLDLLSWLSQSIREIVDGMESDRQADWRRGMYAPHLC